MKHTTDTYSTSYADDPYLLYVTEIKKNNLYYFPKIFQVGKVFWMIENDSFKSEHIVEFKAYANKKLHWFLLLTCIKEIKMRMYS